MSKVWAGIGSRDCPDAAKFKMLAIARYLGEQDYWCRTGAAEGADQAFALGRADRTILYLPWNGYENDWVYSRVKLGTKIGCTSPSTEAIKLASSYHPNWNACSSATQKLHGRNSNIILGSKLDSPVQFVIYWARTDNYGNPLGGTGQGIRIARAYNIPTYNLYDGQDFAKLADIIDFGKL